MNVVRRTMASASGAAFALFAALVSPAAAIDIQEVVGPETGVPGLLVEDRTNPIVTLRISFEGGALLEKAGEEGLTNLLSGMLNEGAGELDSSQFQDRLDELGIRFSASSGGESFRIGVSAVADRFDEAVDLLSLALTEPRFDDAPLARMKRQIASSLRAGQNTPSAEAQRQVSTLIWGDHPYSRDVRGNPETIDAAGADDLERITERLFARDNATVAAVGAIDEPGLADAIDRIFEDLPETGGAGTIPPAQPNLGETTEIALPGSQASLQVVLPAPMRADPDFFAAYLVNHILGGGSFSSRLYEELREKRGLTYGAGSGISTRDVASTWTASVSTRPDNLEEVSELLLGEIERMATEGPSAEELERAKAFVKGAYAINNLGSSGAIAGVLLGIQDNDLGVDYIERREELIDAVTIEDAKRVAAKYLSAEPTVIRIVPESQ